MGEPCLSRPSVFFFKKKISSGVRIRTLVYEKKNIVYFFSSGDWYAKSHTSQNCEIFAHLVRTKESIRRNLYKSVSSKYAIKFRYINQQNENLKSKINILGNNRWMRGGVVIYELPTRIDINTITPAHLDKFIPKNMRISSYNL